MGNTNSSSPTGEDSSTPRPMSSAALEAIKNEIESNNVDGGASSSPKVRLASARSVRFALSTSARPNAVITSSQDDDGDSTSSPNRKSVRSRGDLGSATRAGMLSRVRSYRLNSPNKNSTRSGLETRDLDKLNTMLANKTQQINSRSLSVRNLAAEYDDLAGLFADIEEEAEFEFSMNNGQEAPPSAVISPAHNRRSQKIGGGGSGWKPSAAAARQTRTDEDSAAAQQDDAEDGENVGELVTIAAKKPGTQVKRESYAAGFVKSLFAGKVTVQDLLIVHTAEMDLLKRLVWNHEKRRLLIQELLSIRGDMCTKVRFIAAVDQFERTRDFPEQQKLAKKIVQLFFTKTSKFAIAFAPETIKRVEEDAEFLVIARQEVLELLSKDEALMEICRLVDARDNAVAADG